MVAEMQQKVQVWSDFSELVGTDGAFTCLSSSTSSFTVQLSSVTELE